MFTKEDIIAQLPVTDKTPYTEEDVEKFAGYCCRLASEKDKDSGKLKNPWVLTKSTKDLASLFKRVQAEGIPFDGVHVTLQNTGISYDYVAYKNKMYLAYPETKFDVGIVFK